MNKYIFFTLFILTLNQIAVDQTDDNFLVLKNSNFKELTSQTNSKIIFFFSQKDCNNCQKIRTNLSSLIQENIELGISTFLLDCDQNSDSCKIKLNNRKPPAIQIQISSKFIFYYGDYSLKSIKEFIDKRFVNSKIRLFKIEEFKTEIEKSKKVQQAILVYRGNDNNFKNNLLTPMTQFEPDDSYFICQKGNNCDYLFEEYVSSDISFIKADRRFFTNSNKFDSFENLQSHFYNFKNVFLIPFGIEFEKKVIEEMNPTIILTISEDNELSKSEVDLFKSIVLKYSKRCFASIIKTYSLSKTQYKILENFKLELGVENIPKLIIIEADMETLKMQKYFYSSNEIKEHLVSEFIDDWFNRKLEPSKRSENIREGVKREGYDVISHDTFKSKIFIKKQESVILVYQNLNQSNSNRKFFDLLKKVSSDKQFSNLRFFIIDGLKNDIPVFVTKIPTFLIFSKDSWENPLVYDKDDEKQFIEVLKKRKELVFDVLGIEEHGENNFENTGDAKTQFESGDESEL